MVLEAELAVLRVEELGVVEACGQHLPVAGRDGGSHLGIGGVGLVRDHEEAIGQGTVAAQGEDPLMDLHGLHEQALGEIQQGLVELCGDGDGPLDEILNLVEELVLIDHLVSSRDLGQLGGDGGSPCGAVGLDPLGAQARQPVVATAHGDEVGEEAVSCGLGAGGHPRHLGLEDGSIEEGDDAVDGTRPALGPVGPAHGLGEGDAQDGAGQAGAHDVGCLLTARADPCGDDPTLGPVHYLQIFHSYAATAGKALRGLGRLPVAEGRSLRWAGDELLLDRLAGGDVGDGDRHTAGPRPAPDLTMGDALEQAGHVAGEALGGGHHEACRELLGPDGDEELAHDAPPTAEASGSGLSR